jgi:hypothetical protein
MLKILQSDTTVVIARGHVARLAWKTRAPHFWRRPCIASARSALSVVGVRKRSARAVGALHRRFLHGESARRAFSAKD